MAESKRESFTFFYGKNSPFSQHYRVDFNVAGVVFCCAEQYMMHQKARTNQGRGLGEVCNVELNKAISNRSF